MADKPLKSLTLIGLNDRYIFNSNPLYVTVTGSEDPDTGTVTYTADISMDEIAQAVALDRTVLCSMSNRQLALDTVTASAAAFSCQYKGTQHRVTIYSSGAVKYETFQLALSEDLRPTATDEIYFGVTAAGVVYLKPEYRGLGGSKYEHSISDNGVGISGTRNWELPEEIVIPKTVNGIEVTGLAVGMFMSNKRVKKVTLHEEIKAIPQNCFARAYNLEEVSKTEKIKTIDTAAFYQTAIKKAYFPSLEELSDKRHFYGCANLAVADLGKVFSEPGSVVPRECFGGCEKLEILRNADGITQIGAAGLYATHRLTNKTFLPKLTSVETLGLFLSRVDYDWEKLTGCWFDVMSTSKDVNNYDYSGCTFKSCTNPMRSMFEQHNPAYGGKYIGGCATVCAAMTYSALMGEDIESPDVFVDIVKNGDAELKDVDIVAMLSSTHPDNGCPELIKCLAAAGLHGEFLPNASPQNVQSVYNALMGGALVLARVVGDMEYSNHWVVIRGINDAGEVLVVNPSSHAYVHGTYEAATYAMPIQNMMRDDTGKVNTGSAIYGDDYFVIVTKK